MSLHCTWQDLDHTVHRRLEIFLQSLVLFMNLNCIFYIKYSFYIIIKTNLLILKYIINYTIINTFLNDYFFIRRKMI